VTNVAAMVPAFGGGMAQAASPGASADAATTVIGVGTSAPH
jgi:hypothetical protein